MIVVHVAHAVGDDTGSITRGDNNRVSSHVGTILPNVWDGSASAPIF